MLGLGVSPSHQPEIVRLSMCVFTGLPFVTQAVMHCRGAYCTCIVRTKGSLLQIYLCALVCSPCAACGVSVTQLE